MSCGKASGCCRSRNGDAWSLRLRSLRYPLLPGHEQSKIRRIPHGNHLIFHHVLDERIYILHILNGAQDYEAILFPDG
ncbi:type II toxin-antitoxin system RelE/ParE family toxin [Neorhizobium galegae]|uniref:type II toxin-antitoxin system RelE/ParE family toxin n=1 Tax=Neorhizobium galegae TaxID=399 RepID=UPI001FDAA750|nr:type II toxin-antitoxin system RelE/ParE family toxin [Neorhizobium galegae]